MEIEEFDQLYQQLAPALFKRAYMLLKDEDDAKDCVQAAFLSLWEQRDSIANPSAFVNAVLTNRINTYYRTLSTLERFRRLYPIEMEDDSVDELSIGDVIVFIDKNLSEAVGRVVRCVFFMKMTYKETAEKLGISESTVNKHIVTALRAMRQHFNPLINK